MTSKSVPLSHVHPDTAFKQVSRFPPDSSALDRNQTERDLVCAADHGRWGPQPRRVLLPSP